MKNFTITINISIPQHSLFSDEDDLKYFQFYVTGQLLKVLRNKTFLQPDNYKISVKSGSPATLSDPQGLQP